MSIARFFGSRFSASTVSSRQDDAHHWMFQHWGSRTDSGVVVSERSALALAGVQCCVRLISDAMAGLPAVTEQQIEKTGAWKPIDDDPREYLLNVQPNEYMTPIVARKVWQANALLSGNGLTEVVRNQRGQGVEMWPIANGLVTQRMDRTGARPRLVYSGSIDGRQVELDASDVPHLKGFTLDGYTGLSPIAEARQSIGIGIAAETFGARMYGRDLQSGGWISGATEKDDALQNLREYINQQGGLDNAHLVKILGKDMTFTPGTIPPEDAQFLQTREFALADVCRLYGVPLELVMAQGKTSSWGSGIEQILLAFVELTLAPWAQQQEQELSLKLLTTSEIRSGVRIRFKIREILHGDSGARSAYFERMFRIGALNVNEIRVEEGRNPIPGGEVYADPTKVPPGQPAPSSPPDPREQERDRERKEDEAA